MLLLTHLIIAFIFNSLRVVASGVLGDEVAVTRWFTEQVIAAGNSNTFNRVNGTEETSAIRTYFYVGGRYINTASETRLFTPLNDHKC